MATDEPLFDGEGFFRTLVGHFYENVADDPILRPLYPEELGPAKERLALFLLQYFGDDRRYEALRGAPRLRMRHLPFKIDRAARN
ncbi:MAG TPA: globin, partial [Acidimicrobiales bacterium]|nr:globin [Acidimicrobiales bacterium]